MRVRFFLVLVWTFVLSFSANAQFAVGVSGGANLPFREWHDFPLSNPSFVWQYSPVVSWRSAVVADWSLTSLIGLRAEISYQIWRNRIDLSGSGYPLLDPYEAPESFHNVASSLLTKITPFRRKNIFFLAGTSAARITEAWKGFKSDWAFSRRKIDLTNFNRVQYFADLGAGMRFPIGAKGFLFAEARYQIGLTNFDNLPTVDASIQVLGLNMGYLYQFVPKSNSH